MPNHFSSYYNPESGWSAVMSRGTITRGGQKRFCGESKSEDSGLGEKGVKTQGEEEVSVTVLYRLTEVTH